MNNDINETESLEFDTSKLANLTPDEIKELANKLAKDMVALGDIRISEQTLECVKCGAPRASLTALIGGYNTILCQEHRNRWHTFVENLPEMVAHESAELRLQIAVYKGAEPEALTYHAGLKKAKRDLFRSAERWVESG